MDKQLQLKPIEYTPIFEEGVFKDNLTEYSQFLFKTTGIFCPCTNNIYNNKANFRHQHIKTIKHRNWLKSLQDDSPMILKELQDLKQENKELKIRNGHLTTKQIKLERENNNLKSKIENTEDNKEELNELEEYFKQQIAEKRIKFKTKKRQKFKTKKQELKQTIQVLQDLIQEKEIIIQENKEKYEEKIDKLITNLDNYENVIISSNNNVYKENNDYENDNNDDESNNNDESDNDDDNETIESNISLCNEEEMDKDEFHYITTEQLKEYNELKVLKNIFANTEDKFEKLIKLLFDWDLLFQ